MPQRTKQQRAYELMAKGQVKEAAECLHEALTENESCDLWNDWATVCVALGRVDDAQRGYERALELDPDNTQCHFNFGVVLVGTGSTDRGLKLLRQSFNHLTSPEQSAALMLIDEHAHGKSFLIISDSLPTRGPGGERLLQIARRLRVLGYRVTFIARSEANGEPSAASLRNIGVQVLAGDQERLPSLGIDIKGSWKLDDVLQKGNFEIALIDHSFRGAIAVAEQYIDEIRKFSPRTKIAILGGDRHTIRDWQAADASDDCIARERGLDFMVREAECYSAADLVLTSTDDDYAAWTEVIPDLNIELLPLVLQATSRSTGFDDRRDFLFLADFDCATNRNAMVWLRDEIWPKIQKQLPSAKLHVAGNMVLPEFAAAGIEILEHAPDSPQLLGTYRVFLSPVPSHIGQKPETILALANGTPVVTTSLGSQSLALTDGENVMLGDSAGAFANKAVELNTGHLVWNNLSKAGLRYIEYQFSEQQFQSHLDVFLERIDRLVPLDWDPEHRFSVRLMEELHPEILTGRPAKSRMEVRVLKYADAGERLLSIGHPAEALQQLRHIFTFLRGQTPPTMFFARVFSLMERGYKELEDHASAVRCGRAAKLCLPELNPALRLITADRNHHRPPAAPVISVIIPTLNHKVSLEQCLESLNAQTMAADEFEVIVVDGGSTDGTQEFLQQEKSSFRMVYLAQTGLGNGAARRLAAEHAKGEFLLSIDDLTVASPRLLQEHLDAHRSHPGSDVAVLGAFEYNAIARKRALTHFLSIESFLFPQSRVQASSLDDFPQFITCNLSVRRQAALSAGSFDPNFKFGENTDLGLRLARRGCKVVFHSRAHATHNQEMNMDDLFAHARSHARAALGLMAKNPHLKLFAQFVELNSPITGFDVAQLREMLEPHRAAVTAAANALRQYDAIDFRPFFDARPQQGTAANHILGLFRQTLPNVYWFAFLESLCNEWGQFNSRVSGQLELAGASL